MLRNFSLNIQQISVVHLPYVRLRCGSRDISESKTDIHLCLLSEGEETGKKQK